LNYQAMSPAREIFTKLAKFVTGFLVMPFEESLKCPSRKPRRNVPERARPRSRARVEG
jgi:hypothetical protein